ncbi:MAG TPA: hypothetical protein PLY16_01065 [Candidatus Saccharibacteria bacterium]|nr:hypothetical protein [Candidatus Saccharibacteria bacterium]
MSNGEMFLSDPDDPQPSRLRSWSMSSEQDTDAEYEALLVRLSLEQDRYLASRVHPVEAFENWFEKCDGSFIQRVIHKMAAVAIERIL